MWVWLEFGAHGGVCGGRGGRLAIELPSSHSNILRRIATKHKENAVFERQQIRPPVETLARRVKNYAKGCLTRLKGTECRGGSRGLRPFRRGRGEQYRSGRAQTGQVTAGMEVPWKCPSAGRRYGLTFLHVSAPAIIWTYVYACLKIGGDLYCLGALSVQTIIFVLPGSSWRSSHYMRTT